MIQQGDILIFPSEIPEGAKKQKHNILRHGESGHSHTAVGECDIYDKDGTLYMRVGEGGTTIKHQEHTEQVVKQGDYRIGVVKEVDPFEKIIRQVRD